MDADPRYFQITALGVLAFIQQWQGDFAPEPYILALVVSMIFIFHYLSECYVRRKFTNALKVDYSSVIISALSLFLLLRANILWIYPLAAALCVGGKVFFRHDSGHIFNPANLAIVVLLLLFPSHAWISPGQWGSEGWLAAVMVCLAALVLSGARQLDIAAMFFGTYTALVVSRSLWLGDSFAIASHNLQNGALLIFTFFMITDPKTTPKIFYERFIFALCVAGLAYFMQYSFQIRESLFYALFIICGLYGIYRFLIYGKKERVNVSIQS